MGDSIDEEPLHIIRAAGFPVAVSHIIDGAFVAFMVDVGIDDFLRANEQFGLQFHHREGTIFPKHNNVVNI